MTPFRFSLERIRKFQVQKVGLAEIRCNELRSEYEAGLKRLHEASIRLDEALREFRTKTSNVQAMISHRNHVDQLMRLKNQAMQLAAELEKQWRDSLQELTAAKTRLEGYETLRQSEKVAHAGLAEKAATNELMDGLLGRQWLERNGS